MRHISPSLLAADFGNLQRECEMINRSSAEYLHIDVMDGVFVPNISFGFPVMKAVAEHCTKPLDVHPPAFPPERDEYSSGRAMKNSCPSKGYPLHGQARESILLHCQGSNGHG